MIFLYLRRRLLYLQMEQVPMVLPCHISTVAQKRQTLPWFKRRLFVYLVVSVYSTCLVRRGAFTCLHPETAKRYEILQTTPLRQKISFYHEVRWLPCKTMTFSTKLNEIQEISCHL